MGLFKTAARVAVASSVHGRVQNRQRSKWAAQETPAPPAPPVAQAPAAPAAAAPAQPAAAPTDFSAILEMLTKLGELKAAGVLTDAEFELQKHRILSA